MVGRSLCTGRRHTGLAGCPHEIGVTNGISLLGQTPTTTAIRQRRRKRDYDMYFKLRCCRHAR